MSDASPTSSSKVANQPASAVAATFIECKRHLKSFIARFSSRADDIEDIVQEAFLRAYEAERERSVSAPKAFLFAIARNLAVTEAGRRGRQQVSGSDLCLPGGESQDRALPEVPDREATLEDQVDGEAKLAAFCRAVATLPPQCRRAFLMRKVKNLSYHEIATELGVTVRTVEKHVAVGLQRCGAYLRRLGYEVGVDEDAAVANARHRPREANRT